MTTAAKRHGWVTTLVAVGALVPGFAAGQEPEGSTYDRIWKQTELYRDAGNPAVQSVAFTGRYQLDHALVDRNEFEELTTRRWRMGAKIRAFGEFTLHAEADFDPEEDRLYQRLTDAYLAWSRNKAFKLAIGKHGAGFTLDGMTSSKELLTIDRSNLTNNLWFTQEYMPGVSGSGEIDHWHYQIGVYSAGSRSREFGHFDGKYFLLHTLGYDFARKWGVKQALLAANYVFQDPDPQNTFTRRLRHVGSLNFSYDAGVAGFRADISAATGSGSQSDLWGASIMPFLKLTERLQVVARYTYLNSTDPDGVIFARYESQAVGGRGDNYNEIYAGLNYYLYGHRLKLQTGVQQADMNDAADNGGSYHGWAWTTGLRVSW